MKKAILLVGMMMLLMSCSVKYKLNYHMSLKKPQSKNLHYEDDKFSFYFFPVSSGIYFSIYNKTDSNSSLFWDKTYFIEPNGNSHRALDTDILKENHETVQKSSNESMIPSHANFSRFTTSSTNMNKISLQQIYEINSYFSDINSNNITSFRTTSIYDEIFYDSNPYYYQYIEEENSESVDQFRAVINHIKSRNNLGIGFAIKLNEKIHEYRFDFNIRKISLTKLEQDSYQKDKRIEGKINYGYAIGNSIQYEAEEKNNWKIIKVDKHIKEL